MTACRPARLPWFGHAPAFLRDRLGFLQRSARALGDVARLEIGGPTVLLAHPDDARHVLGRREGPYRKSPRLTSAAARALLGESVLTSEGPEHLEQRRLLQPLLGGRGLAERLRPVAARAEEMQTRWRDGEVVDLGAALHRLTRRCALEMLFGEPLVRAHPELEAIVEQRRTYVDRVLASPVPGLDAWPTPARRRFRRGRARLAAIVAEELRRPPTSAIQHSSGAATVRERLAACWHEANRSLTVAAPLFCSAAASLADQLAAVAVAAYETPRHLLAWSLDLLARHPDVQAHLRREAEAAATFDPDRLPYAARVVSEVLRLYPPTWLIVRLAAGDDLLPSGAALRAGTKVYVSPWVLQRDPRWFPEPERFDPERFAGSMRPSAYLPFGLGPRQCIGEGLARAEAVAVLAAILSRWELEPVGAPPRPRPRVALEPAGPVRVRVVRRR